MNFSIASSSEKTQYFSLYLKTPRLGFPGINKPYSTILTKQKPKKSRGICMKSGVLFGMSLIIELPTTVDSIVYEICSSISLILLAFSMYRALLSLISYSGRELVILSLNSSNTLNNSFLSMARFFSSSNYE